MPIPEESTHNTSPSGDTAHNSDVDEEKEKKKTRMESLEESLYSRTHEDIEERERRRLKPRDFGVQDEWKEIKEVNVSEARRPIAKMILIGALVFFVFSVAFSSYFFFLGGRISPENVIIDVQGPALIGGGEELNLHITVRNNNPVPIEDADLIIEYPIGTHSAANIDIELPRFRVSLGTIHPGEEVRKTIEAVLFGEENSKKNIDISVEYGVEGSNAIFYSNFVYNLVLSSSPLSLIIEAYDETISGQEIEFLATVKSSSKNIVRNVMLRAEYPFGFEFSSSNPEPIFANSTWYLGDIEPGGETEIVIKGTLSGQDEEERIFRFVAGLQSEADRNIIGAEFVNVTESLLIKRPFITATMTLNNKTSEVISSLGGEKISGIITYTNNLPTQIFDGEIEIEFIGSAIDETTVEGTNGFYRSIDNKLIWTRDTLSSLRIIPPGASGEVKFSFNSFGLSSGMLLRNPEIKLNVTIAGKRLSDSSIPEEVYSTLSRRVRISSNLTLISKVLHFTGPFENIGPIPPKVEKETTYTIVFTVLNSYNTVANAEVVTTLPTYVEWLGVTSPLTEDVTYTAIGRSIVWNLGEVKSGTGTSLPPRELSFQVSLLPSISQVQSVPELVNGQILSGIDRFTESRLSNKRGPLNTGLAEPGFNQIHRQIVP